MEHFFLHSFLFKNVFGVISQYDFLYLITNDCDYVVKSASKVRCNMLQSAFSNGRIVKVMYKCECDVAPLASYGLVVVGGFDLGTFFFEFFFCVNF